MAHWPQTVRGNLYVFAFAFIAVPILVQLVVALSGAATWISIAVVCSATAAVYLWIRRMRTVRDVAVTDAPSFGDVLARIHAREALEPTTKA